MMYMILGGAIMGGPMGGGLMDGADMGMDAGVQEVGFLSTLPPWLATIIMLLGVVLIGWIIGKIIGRIIAGIIYPDPDKETLFDLKKRLIIAGAVVCTVFISGICVYIAQKPAKEPDIADVGNMGLDMNMSNNEMKENPAGADMGETQTEQNSQTGTESSTNTDSSESSSAESESSTSSESSSSESQNGSSSDAVNESGENTSGTESSENSSSSQSSESSSSENK